MHNGKLICHNYGHGGAGWTFLFGCVNGSIRQFEHTLEQHPSFKNKPITIIGAGCYGLLTAVSLAHKGYTVRIIARETENIPSNKAAGFFFPRARKSSTPHERATFQERGIESYQTYLQIFEGTHPFITHGAQLLPCYFSPDIDPGFAPYIDRGLMKAPEKVIIDFDNGKQYEAMEYTSLFINAAHIMEELQHLRSKLGITITNAEITDFDEVTEPIIFNCAGMGAKKLTADPRIVPVQGHLINLKNQPDINLLQYMVNVKVVMSDIKGRPRDELIYFAPRDNGILGVTFLRGQDSLTANPHEFDRLLQRCHDFFGT
jgi:glycine/D-amino acid oxidase-like deaminating enzyme